MLEIIKENVDPCDISFDQSNNGNQIYKDIDLLERKMRFSILLKFSQSTEFRNELFKYKDFFICYKQVNYSKTLSGLLGVTNKNNVIAVLDKNSISGHNLVGKILMDLCKKF